MFPDKFDRGHEKNYYAKLKQKSLLTLQMIIDDREVDSAVDELERYFTSMIRPANFTGNDSIEIRYERDFEDLCHSLSSHTNVPVKSMSTKEFYSLIDHVKRKK